MGLEGFGGGVADFLTMLGQLNAGSPGCLVYFIILQTIT
jgi:hypothetical protein